jgi:hypothetical protein
MCHSRSKGAAFKAERLRSESRQNFERRAIRRLRPWKAPGVGLYLLWSPFNLAETAHSAPALDQAAAMGNQGRQLTMDPREIRTYRVRLYSVSQ